MKNMKKISLIILFFACSSLRAEIAIPNQLKVPSKIKSKTESEEPNDKTEYPGSSTFTQCQEFSAYPWPSAQKKDDSWKIFWNRLQRNQFNKINEILTNEDTNKIREILAENKEAQNANYDQLCGQKSKSNNQDQGNYNQNFDNVGPNSQEQNQKLKDLCGKLSKSEYKGTIKSLASAFKDAFNEGELALSELKECQGMLSATKYESSTMTDPDYKIPQVKKSFDGLIQCQSRGAETQDYPGCNTLVNAYDGLFMGRQVLNGVHQVQYAGHKEEQNEKVAKDGGKDLTIGLKVQKDDIKKRKEIAGQKLGAETAALGVLGTAFMNMPSIDNIYDGCLKMKKGQLEEIEEGYNQYMGSLLKALKVSEGSFFKKVTEDSFQDYEDNNSQSLPMQVQVPDRIMDQSGYFSGAEIKLNPKKLCNDILYNNADQSIAINGAALDAAKTAMIKAGIDMAKYGVTMAMLDKQSGLLDKVIKKVDSFEPPDTNYTQEELVAFECQVNPKLPKCPGNATQGKAQGFYNPGLSIGGFNRATSNGNRPLNTGAAGEKSVASDSSESHGDSIGSIGGPIRRGASSGGLANSGVSAASVKKGGGGGGAAGGGGGGSGSASAPSNGLSNKSGQGRRRGPRASMNSKSAYGGGGGTMKYKGGRSSRNGKSKAKNPFAKLFKKRGKKGGTLNFRGIASKGIGAKNNSLFHMLSHRYKQVNKKGRLLEYMKAE